MHFHYLVPLIVLGANAVQANVIAERAAKDGPCTGAGGAPGVCVPTAGCTSGGGKFISNACPGLPEDIKCCTKTSCGKGGNCRFASSCSTSALTGLCPGPADFKCCVPGDGGSGSSGGGSGGGGSGQYPKPNFPAVGACKAAAVSGAQDVVAANPGGVREIYCTRDCACPGTSDHCCGLAIDFMCSSAGGVSAMLQLAFAVLVPKTWLICSPPPHRCGPLPENPSLNGS